MNFKKSHKSFSIKEILDLHASGKLELNPGFQRASVWTLKDQRALIDTVLRGMPLPTLFLWLRKEGNKQVFDVIDGKQRIESLIAFTRARSAIAVKFDPEGDPDWEYQDPHEWTWKEVRKYERKIESRFLSYELPVVVLYGALPDIEKVFIRINSTGKKLTPQEVRHAKWYSNSPLLRCADAISKEKKYEAYFLQMGILSPGQISRMKAIELVTELMLTIDHQDVLDKKKAIDKVMGKERINGNTLSRLEREVKSTLDLIKRAFPEIPTSRFKHSSDFYALFFAVWKMRRDGYHFKDESANSLAFHILNQLGLDLVNYRLAFKEGKPQKLMSPALEYHATVLQGTDTARNRRDRVKIVESILRPIFPLKDSKRLFSQEQKQLLWHGAKSKCCSNPACGRELTWKDVHMDHIKPFTKGGRTDLRNAQLLCARCNSSKGGR